MGIADDLKKAFFEGYEAGKKDAEFYVLHCGDETPVSNGDRIRSMTDEELAEFFVKKMDFICKKNDRYCDGLHCTVCAIDWLKQEVTE